VRVVSEPPGAACFLDGQYRGIVPTNFVDLPAGNHHVRCTFKGRDDITQTVQIKAGQTTTLTFTSPPRMPERACSFCRRVQPLPFTVPDAAVSSVQNTGCQRTTAVLGCRSAPRQLTNPRGGRHLHRDHTLRTFPPAQRPKKRRQRGFGLPRWSEC